jgi:hypothetical protein
MSKLVPGPILSIKIKLVASFSAPRKPCSLKKYNIA